MGGDIAGAMELLPGVATPDNSAALSVRGSLTRDVSIVLDGLELYDPFHLQAFQSPFSLIDSQVVDRIDFFGGGFTADFGDRHGGFVEVATVTPASPRRGELELGTLNSRVSYQTTLAERPGAWLFSARGWYPEATVDSLALGGGERLDPHFADAYTKVSWSVSPRALLSAHGLLAYDSVTFVEKGEVDSERVTARTRSGYVWLRALNLWSDDLESDTVLSGGWIEKTRGGVAAQTLPEIVVDDHRTVGFTGLRNNSVWRFSEDHALKAGVDIRYLSARYRYENLSADPAASVSFRRDPDGTSFGAYLAHRVRLTPNLATELGFRWDRQTYTDDNQLAPRFNAVWRPGERSELRLAVGRVHQSQRIHELQVEDGETEFQIAEASEQAELTFQHRFPGGLRFRLDAYFREISDVRPRYENLLEPIELFPETRVDRVRIAPSEARLRGAELLLRNETGGRLTWRVSYARSAAEDIVKGQRFLRSRDQTHSAKFLVGLRPAEHWSLSLSGTAHTGWPTTPSSARFTLQPDGSVLLEETLGVRNSDRFPRYARLDFKARRSFDLREGKLSLTLEALNLTDRANACCVDGFSYPRRTSGTADGRPDFDHWLGFTPSFSLLWEF
jgi:hypothetical protein